VSDAGEATADDEVFDATDAHPIAATIARTEARENLVGAIHPLPEKSPKV